MILFLYGEDLYRRNAKVQELLRVNKEKRLNADIFIANLEEDSDMWVRARDFLAQPSMFSEAKTLVIKESGSVDEKEWIALLKREATTTNTVCIISDTKAPKKAFSFLLKDPVKVQEFEELEERKLEIFLKKEADGRNLHFSKEAWSFFISYVGKETSRSIRGILELEKISLLYGDKEIKKSDLSPILKITSQEEVFQFARRIIASRKKSERMCILERLFLQGEAGAYIFNALAYQARGEDVALLSDLDVKIKSGNAEYEEALLCFVLSV